MPLACPLSLTRRACAASVRRNASRLTEPSSYVLFQFRAAHRVARAAPSLKAALLLAAKKHVAPRLHVDLDDVSFVPLGARKTWQAFTQDQRDDEAEDQEDSDSRDTEAASYSTTTQALQKLLARFIAHSADPTRHAQEEDSTADDGPSLASAGATRLDLERWLEILTTRDSLRAANLLVHGSTPPSFVFLYLLRREHIRPDALRLLIRYLPTWYQATFQDLKYKSAPLDPYASVQPHIFRVFVRLLRHCKRVWPEATKSVSVFLTTYLRLSTTAESESFVDQMYRLTVLYNRALYLVAEPAQVSPFKNIIHQEAAQATLIRFMAEQDPPLVISREGYRGVIRVQLASRKTEAEREWARLKSPSWPPWREDRTGMDSHIGLDYGVSRAHHVLNRMQEAGYALQPWDQVALIYAGWDTDLSPTIQTRVLLREGSGPRMPPEQIWLARIRTTRTAQQAWACFLAYKDENLPPSRVVYHAMFQVLIQERKRVRLGPQDIGHETDRLGVSPLYPGDTREIGSPPPSSHQLTYVRVEMPSVQELFRHMQEENLRPSGKTLALLLDSAESIEEGIAYLQSVSHEFEGAVETLFAEKIDHDLLSALPDSVFASYVGFLCRFPHTPLNKLVPNKFKYTKHWELRLDQPLFRALYLLVVQRRQYRPNWNVVFRSLARRDAPVVSSLWRRVYLDDVPLKPEQDLYDRMFVYYLTRQNIAAMQENDLTLDAETFRYFCIIAEHAAKASNSILQQYGHMPEEATEVEARHMTRAKEMLQDVTYVRDQFWDLVRGRADKRAKRSTDPREGVELPPLLTTPGPAIIHAYIRTLGFMRDYDGLEELLLWMHRHHHELSERRAEDHNGAIVMRRALTAFRVFIEGSWEDQPTPVNVEDEDETPGSVGAPQQQIERVARLVGGVPDWGGWPSDDEVEVYLERASQ